MFKEKVNARTDGRTSNNGPWHKLAGLWPVELKINGNIQIRGVCVEQIFDLKRIFLALEGSGSQWLFLASEILAL